MAPVASHCHGTNKLDMNTDQILTLISREDKWMSIKGGLYNVDVVYRILPELREISDIKYIFRMSLCNTSSDN